MSANGRIRRACALGVGIAALAVAAEAIASPAGGYSGRLDRSFGRHGIVTTGFGAIAANRAAIGGGLLQPDGRIVAVAARASSSARELAVVRYLPDGSPDASFGHLGIATTDLGAAVTPRAAALEPDGRIVVLASIARGATTATTLTRYDPDGSLDASFGSGGTVTADLGNGAVATAVAIQPDGKILAAGEGSNGTVATIAVARFNADGSPDASFAGDGVATAALGAPGPVPPSAVGVLVQPDGRIVAAGIAGGGFATARLDPDGGLDSSFGSGGTVTTTVPSGNPALSGGIAALLQTDGKIVLAGSIGFVPGEGGGFALVRYDDHGSLDPSFGVGGIDTGFPNCCYSGRIGLAAQADGKLVLAGEGPSGMFGVFRFNAGGGLDPGFGSNGAAAISAGGKPAVGALVLDAAGRAVVVGAGAVCQPLGSFRRCRTMVSSHLTVARLDGNGSPDPSFGAAGEVTTSFGTHAVKGSATASSIVRERGGRFVVVGSARPRNTEAQSYGFALARYRPSGALDRSFGDRGRVLTVDPDGASPLFARASDALPEPPGKIVVVGTEVSAHGGDQGFVLARYLPDGSLDSSFGAGGIVVTHFQVRAVATAAARQPDGKIVVGASVRGQLVLARYRPDGSLDASFGNSGKAGLHRREFLGPNSVIVERPGRIITATEQRIFAVRASGAVDRSFGTRGSVDVPVGKNGYVNGVVRVRRGRLLVFAVVRRHIALFRYRPDGSVDRSFGRRGKVVSQAGPFARVTQSALQRDGKLIVAGSFYRGSQVPTHPPFGLIRFNRGGALDRSFGDRGRVVSRVHGLAKAIAAGPRGRVLVAGETLGGELRLARFRG